MSDKKETGEKLDGRRERTKRTRAAIVGALTALVDEGRLGATASEVAERAGVALRSIGQHFASREEMFLAVAQHQANRFPPSRYDIDASFEDRLAAFAKDRAKLLEASSAMRLAAGVVVHRSPSVADAMRLAAAERRAASSRLFAREIAAAGDPEATDRAVSVVSSGHAWDSLRRDMGLGTTAARQQLVFMMRALLSR